MPSLFVSITISSHLKFICNKSSIAANSLSLLYYVLLAKASFVHCHIYIYIYIYTCIIFKSVIFCRGRGSRGRVNKFVFEYIMYVCPVNARNVLTLPFFK